ncbi:MAG TPA: hypothetical protein VKW06_04575 [Candidatus Angelobacter sp.]|nr:hypothetical protein [Candidatus Angelobacter sp.]
MRSIALSIAVALSAAVISFFLSVAFLCFVLLIMGAVTHTRPDMTLTYKAAAPVAALALLCGFFITLARSLRSANAHK